MKLKLSRSSIKSLVLLNGITYLTLAIILIAYVGFSFWAFSLYPWDYCVVSLIFSCLDLLMFFISGGVAIGIFLTRKNISESKQLWESVTFLILIISMVTIFCLQTLYQIIRISLYDIRIKLLIKENNAPLNIIIIYYIPVAILTVLSTFFCFCHLFVAILNYFHSKKEYQKNTRNNDKFENGTEIDGDVNFSRYYYGNEQEVVLLEGSDDEIVDSDERKSVNSSYPKLPVFESSREGEVDGGEKEAGKGGENVVTNVMYNNMENKEQGRLVEEDFEDESDESEEEFFEDGY